MKTGPKAILATAGIVLVVSGLLWPRSEPVYGMSVGFLRYGQFPAFDYVNNRPTHVLCAIFGVTNTGNRRIYCRTNFRGIGGVFVDVLTTNGWDTVVPAWNCLAESGDLEPDEGFEIPVTVQTNLSWRTTFGFRPYAHWEMIPHVSILINRIPDAYPLFQRPPWREVPTETVPAPGNLWPRP